MKRPILIVVFVALLCVSCTKVRRAAMELAVERPSSSQNSISFSDPLTLVFDGLDATRKRIAVSLKEVARDFRHPTDIQFLPDRPSIMIVLEQEGKMKWHSLEDDTSGTILELKVLTVSEQGLLGLAFHPNFRSNRKFYLNATVKSAGKEGTQISEWKLPGGENLAGVRAAQTEIILEVQQPYANHNAGQLAFGPDGLLYIGLGDGGWGGDPHGHGQNRETLLGAMLRIDVDHPAGGKPYGIPKDNPFVESARFRREIWAWGLRNPWRYSFDPQGRLIAADVGQDLWEEISIVERGKNYGWNIREGSHCFKPSENCPEKGLEDPIIEYGHEEGQSITGGYVYSGKKISELFGKYLFGDFVTGRLWAAELPKSGEAHRRLRGEEIYTLGRWPLQIVTFGKGLDGELYLADYRSGMIYRIEAAQIERE
ncbi:MAG: PQQ-dependent sugar dehydrogenase [Deltaproteobacteria bacterium]|nr:PQQ-dependent sugar dehydrogenase [Deltaproteobacteria bacterium]